jgi:putative transposase
VISLQPAQVSVRRQCQLLGVARSTAYHRPQGESASTLRLLRVLDELYTAHPFFGVEKMTAWLRRDGWCVSPKRVRRLLRQLALHALQPKRRLSRPGAGQRIYPYLLRDLAITRPNQVWCTDITYVRLRDGFAYLVAVMDWHSRRVLAWELSNSLDAVFCVRTLRTALAGHGPPEIFNTDQGCQFTSAAFVGLLQERGIQVSMDGRGRALDNVFIERLWRSVKYEEAYLREYISLVDAHLHLTRYFDFYNHRRPHQGLDYQTPEEVYHPQAAATACAS